MAFLKVENIKIAGFSAAVPKQEICNITSDPSNEVIDFVNSTGVKKRRLNPRFTTSDLCEKAASRLIEDLNWEKNEIDAIIFVSQTADYILPATACLLQTRLGLSKYCAALDINLGCSGWVYGMNVLSSMMQTGYIKKALLCTGDTNTIIPDNDRLFGDAGTVTALEYTPGAEQIYFNLGTDGEGGDAIMVPHGGARHFFDEESLKTETIEGQEYKMIHSRMKGMDVFAFGISTVPKAVKALAKEFAFDYQDADFYVFHQANLMMNKRIDKKLGLPAEKTLYSIDEFGNTSSASIPLTIVTRLPKERLPERLNLLCCGFGVGLSWGVIKFQIQNPIISKLVELE